MSAMDGCKQHENCLNHKQIQKLYLKEQYNVDVNMKDEKGKEEFKNFISKIL